MGHAWYGLQRAVMDHLNFWKATMFMAGYLSLVASTTCCSVCQNTSVARDLNSIGRHLIVSQSFCPAGCDEPICASWAVDVRAESGTVEHVPVWAA